MSEQVEQHTSGNSEALKYSGPVSRAMRVFSGLRMASYASDVGEATRGTLPGFFVNAMYAVTIGYIGTDLYFKYNDNRARKDLKHYMGYHTLWHTQASLLFPSLTIHTIVGATKKITPRINWMNARYKKWMPAGIALASIPFLIHPLDHLADFTMRHTYCRYFGWSDVTIRHEKKEEKFDCTNGRNWSESC